MSDTGRFVAAAIGDKTFSDILEENDKLRAENDKLHAIVKDKEYAVEITGPNGTPIYAFGDVLQSLPHRATLNGAGTEFFDDGEYTR